MNTSTSLVTVWFDSQCPLCSKEIAVMKRLDWRTRVDFIDIYASADCPLDPSRLLERFHAQETGGPILDGAAAFAAGAMFEGWLDGGHPAQNELTSLRLYSHNRDTSHTTTSTRQFCTARRGLCKIACLIFCL